MPNIYLACTSVRQLAPLEAPAAHTLCNNVLTALGVPPVSAEFYRDFVVFAHAESRPHPVQQQGSSLTLYDVTYAFSFWNVSDPATAAFAQSIRALPTGACHTLPQAAVASLGAVQEARVARSREALQARLEQLVVDVTGSEAVAFFRDPVLGAALRTALENKGVRVASYTPLYAPQAQNVVGLLVQYWRDKRIKGPIQVRLPTAAILGPRSGTTVTLRPAHAGSMLPRRSGLDVKIRSLATSAGRPLVPRPGGRSDAPGQATGAKPAAGAAPTWASIVKGGEVDSASAALARVQQDREQARVRLLASTREAEEVARRRQEEMAAEKKRRSEAAAQERAAAETRRQEAALARAAAEATKAASRALQRRQRVAEAIEMMHPGPAAIGTQPLDFPRLAPPSDASAEDLAEVDPYQEYIVGDMVQYGLWALEQLGRAQSILINSRQMPSPQPQWSAWLEGLMARPGGHPLELSDILDLLVSHMNDIFRYDNDRVLYVPGTGPIAEHPLVSAMFNSGLRPADFPAHLAAARSLLQDAGLWDRFPQWAEAEANWDVYNSSEEMEDDDDAQELEAGGIEGLLAAKAAASAPGPSAPLLPPSAASASTRAQQMLRAVTSVADGGAEAADMMA